jgi:co-chaperonin GroES (HSP10)
MPSKSPAAASRKSSAGSHHRISLEDFPKKFRPLGAKVALKRHPKDVMAPGSELLFRPEQKLKNSDRATVLALGPDCRLGLKVGQVVVVSRFADGDREWEGERLMIIPEDDIMGVEEG